MLKIFGQEIIKKEKEKENIIVANNVKILKRIYEWLNALKCT